jgi:hypothetical protein
MKIHAYASEAHYVEHLSAIWKHLPLQLQGSFFTVPGRFNGEADDVFMLAGFNDVTDVLNNRIIYVEHGAGQKYAGIKEDFARRYHGGQHPNRVVAYISPRQEVADSWGRPAFAAGSPVCDPYQLFPETMTDPYNPDSHPVAVITFHFDAPQICPELHSAFDHYADKMPEIVAALQHQGYTVWGHRHPRFERLRGYWDKLGLYEATVDEVRRYASIVIADNTSVLFEAMYLQRQTIALNAPWFRRDVEHGLRFWDHAPLDQVDGPDGLIELVGGGPLPTTTDPHIYGRPFSDGMDGLRAATWIATHVAGM